MFILLHPYKFTEFHHMHYELDFFEKKLCTENEFNSMFELAKLGISQIIQSQKTLLEGK